MPRECVAGDLFQGLIFKRRVRQGYGPALLQHPGAQVFAPHPAQGFDAAVLPRRFFFAGNKMGFDLEFEGKNRPLAAADGNLVSAAGAVVQGDVDAVQPDLLPVHQQRAVLQDMGVADYGPGLGRWSCSAFRVKSRTRNRRHREFISPPHRSFIIDGVAKSPISARYGGFAKCSTYHMYASAFATPPCSSSLT